jgi:methylglyoxal synthase
LSHPITLALIAHKRYKEMLAYFVLDHRAEFSRFHLIATRDTGRIVQKWTGLKVHLLEHGPEGGDQQIGVLAAANEVQAVIFFRDPLAVGNENEPVAEPDFADLLQVCDLREIPMATNRATAEALLFFLLHSPDRAIVTARPWGFVHPPLEAEQGGSANLIAFKKGA